VHAAVNSSSTLAVLGDNPAVETLEIQNEGDKNIKGKAVKISLSPKRLVTPVIKPALNDFALL